MKDPIFLLQSGGALPTEKIACGFSNYPVRYCHFTDISKLDPKTSLTQFVPVGSVEFTKAYSQHVGLKLPESITYGIYDGQLDDYLMRDVREATYGEAAATDFVKPIGIKSFTGNIKGTLEEEAPGFIPDDEPVWISSAVPFGPEFRFYIHDFVGGGKIQGWSRYDDSGVYEEGCPQPDFGLVEEIMNEMQEGGAPGAYTIDIGWRPDIDKYCLVELNDAWSLGYYENKDPQSNPPTRQQYADMLVSRWTQILFCQILDNQNKNILHHPLQQ